jgi:outer membrane protein assembly factor BamA
MDIDKGKSVSQDILVNYQFFNSPEACDLFLKIEFLPLLQKNGYLAASIDSVVKSDLKTIAWIHIGAQYKWGRLKIDSATSSELLTLGLDGGFSKGMLLEPTKLIEFKERILEFYENNGYPFASIKFDSSFFDEGDLYAILNVFKGPLYHIDSIVVNGSLRIQKNFLAKYLNIPPGSIYKKSILNDVSKRIVQSGFIQESKPWDITLYGTGSALNLYTEPKRSSQISLLAGLMPSNNQLRGKLLLTGEADMQLRNSFGGGESIALSWQQIQVQSPRLQIGFQKPYLFNTNAGVDFQFNLLKKDSSFLTINTRVGVQYAITNQYTAKLFFQQFTSSLLDVDTNFIKSTKRLPGFLDFSNRNIGLEMAFNSTDDNFNPRSGLEWSVRFAGGTRNIQKNNSITSIKQDQFGKPFNFTALYDTIRPNSSQFRTSGKFDMYSKLGRQSTFKTGIKAGLIKTERLLTNELFQIGGINTLRGFDEESLFASQYLIASIEYRYLIGPLSYLFTFLDGATIQRRSLDNQFSGNFFGMGMGLSFETKSGIFKLAYAAGKQPSGPVNFRESKIHFGFVSLF